VNLHRQKEKKKETNLSLSPWIYTKFKLKWALHLNVKKLSI
jgi:hypothetical protein